MTELRWDVYSVWFFMMSPVSLFDAEVTKFLINHPRRAWLICVVNCPLVITYMGNSTMIEPSDQNWKFGIELSFSVSFKAKMSHYQGQKTVSKNIYPFTNDRVSKLYEILCTLNARFLINYFKPGEARILKKRHQLFFCIQVKHQKGSDSIFSS